MCRGGVGGGGGRGGGGRGLCGQASRRRSALHCCAALQAAPTPAAVVAACDITVAMLSDPEACLAVACGGEGSESVAAAMAPGKGYVDVSTVDAATSQAVAAVVRAAGGSFLEAPVSGSKGPAEQGQLVFLTAGDRQLFDAAGPLLEVMGKASLFLGDVGAGANMKLVGGDGGACGVEGWGWGTAAGV